MSEEEKKISKFSSGINILMRVDFLWKNCHNYKRNGMYSKWNEELDSVWLELARDLKPEEFEDTDKEGNVVLDEKNVKKEGWKTKFEKFDGELKDLMPFTDSGQTGFGKPNDKMVENRGKQYKILKNKQLFLARLENELGKGTSWGDSEDDWD